MQRFLLCRGHIENYIGVLCIFIAGNGYCEESIEYVAEHLLEVPMDTRTQSYPATPIDDTASETRFQLGYGSFDAGKLNNEVLMFAGQYFFPLDDTWGLIAGGFYDHFQFSGQNGSAVGGVLVVDAPNVPGEFDADITDVSGSGKYAGASLALTYDAGGLWRWQLGFALAALDVDKFKIDFNTKNLDNNFSGSFDYAGRYSVKTLFLGLEMTPRNFLDGFVYSPHFIIVSNMPRVGFKGRFTGPDFDYSGNTASAGNGKHIPDNYLGMGVNIEHVSSGLRMDLGATLFTYMAEPAAHKGISNPLFLTLSLPVY
jgi:hypothetical protein